MHSNKFKDPLISRAQPVTIIVPIVEETLRMAGTPCVREQVLERFMNGQPRLAVVHGAEDHPPNIGCRDTIRRLIRQIWAQGALPFEVSQSFPCEELALGTQGSHYALLSRNFCTASLAAHIESHGYDAAVILGICDKMMTGCLRALIEADLARQRRKARPVFAMVIPPVIGREVFLANEERRKLQMLKDRFLAPEREELDQLSHRPVKPHTYARIKVLLERAFHRRIIAEEEKDDIQCMLAKCAAALGANCAASEESVAHRMILASLGLVPRRFDICLKAPSDEQLSEAVSRLIQAVQKKQRRISVSSLVRSNLTNAVSVWSATGGQPAWMIHLMYLADAIEKKLTIADMTKRTQKVPQILAIDDSSGNSPYAMALETDSGGNSGIDTLMRTLSEKRLIEDRAPTLNGSWAQRIMEARSANANFIYSTMTPFSRTCGLVGMHGNICAGAVACLGPHGQNGSMGQFNRKVYLAVYYLGMADLQADAAIADGVLERLKRKVSREDLYDTWFLNWHQDTDTTTPDLFHWSKPRLWEYLVAANLLRVLIVVAGAGPHASGMPEVRLSLNASSRPLASMSVLVTDGRVSYHQDCISIAHVVPEAFDGGGLLDIRTGDWVYLDFSRGEFQVVTPSARNGYKVLAPKLLLKRPDRKRRIAELERRRGNFLPSFRVLMHEVSSVESGISPID